MGKKSIIARTTSYNSVFAAHFAHNAQHYTQSALDIKKIMF